MSITPEVLQQVAEPKRTDCYGAELSPIHESDGAFYAHVSTPSLPNSAAPHIGLLSDSRAASHRTNTDRREL